jgi:uncharacterized protein YndB with AHSA1/START domain
MAVPEFSWPSGFSPDQARVHVHNELSMRAPLLAVWAALVEAADWQRWFSGARDVRLPDGARDLAPGMTFHWSTGGVPLESRVTQYEPGSRLAWTAESPLISAFHAWVMEGDSDSCQVVTEETQRGLLPSAFAPLVRRRMLRAHQAWLEALERHAQATSSSRAG